MNHRGKLLKNLKKRDEKIFKVKRKNGGFLINRCRMVSLLIFAKIKSAWKRVMEKSRRNNKVPSNYIFGSTLFNLFFQFLHAVSPWVTRVYQIRPSSLRSVTCFDEGICAHAQGAGALQATTIASLARLLALSYFTAVISSLFSLFLFKFYKQRTV